ncbi:hypothetical protein [Colwellia sp. RSH04]|uniref:hypothetical protein n=1 Tax=Colwellia sp. RSH04 TaxID=2305464 RepID=UPI000E57704D|nr:hypothetical protein [Colwellia sp. RSH04]RHW77136.1 hypothetical protein D1094_04385 [Colwellia sp. RSH04]
MFSQLFKNTPIVDDGTKAWIYDSFLWCLQNFDVDYFKQKSQIILPSNDFYPGKCSSPQEMAQTIFTNTLSYAGMSNWPIELVDISNYRNESMTQLALSKPIRGESSKIQYLIPSNTIKIPYQIDQIRQPQDFIAYLVQHLASIMLAQLKLTVPGGNDLQPQAIDLIACFLGFGVIFSNTAYQFKGGCGSCNIKALNRQNALPEVETVYALALFCASKGIAVSKIKPHLKSHLFKTLKSAHKEITYNLKDKNTQEYQLFFQVTNPA